MHTLSLVLFCLVGLGFGEEVAPAAHETQKILSNILLAAKAAPARKPAGKAAATAAALKKQRASSSGFDANELAGV
eukprot:CAMPEP_0169122246 /NCGR_PEP_ID=MMETSP1015-20121227/33117_1 /TAXON_ID=342587 /ORGANISM="Karlodinium micrum, Strain CCMP2283" /LENGTH=75 /DNA_ID=CAMNT_0009185439 /DNA_START=56 /DNA_END=280 /DNA_ORIENTATION=+